MLFCTRLYIIRNTDIKRFTIPGPMQSINRIFFIPMDLTKFEHCWQTNKNYPAPQPNRILIRKPPGLRLVIPEEVVMQPSFTVGILVLYAEGLVCAIRYSGFLFQILLIFGGTRPNLRLLFVKFKP